MPTLDRVRFTLLDAAVAILVLGLVALSVVHFGGGTEEPAILASPAMTPGSLNPDVTQETIAQTICVRGWTATVRPSTGYTNMLKGRQMPLYGETGSPSDYQEDHLISLEMGGSPTDPRNLWPEPYPRASQMDQIENQLNSQICDGQLTLAQAQQQESEIKHTQG